MRRQYLLADKEFWMDVISLQDLKFPPIYATRISASGLKKFIKTSSINEVYVTSTIPNVYVEVGNCLFVIPYRPFLSFLSAIYEMEDFVKLNWRTDGF